jgi:hypothetical protein
VATGIGFLLHPTPEIVSIAFPPASCAAPPALLPGNALRYLTRIGMLTQKSKSMLKKKITFYEANKDSRKESVKTKPLVCSQTTG